MKLGLDAQPKIAKSVLKLIDLIEIKTITPEDIALFSTLKKPLLLHLKNFSDHKLVFLTELEISDWVSEPEVEEAINQSKFPWISFHLGFPLKNWVLDDNQDVIAAGKPVPEEVFFNQLKYNLQTIQRLYPQVKIALETAPCLPETIARGAYKYVSDPEFISNFLKKTKSFLLLDLGHISVTAYNLDYNQPTDYLKKLPLDRVLEIHIHRPRFSAKEGFWRDAHLPIESEQIKLLQFVLKKAKNAQAVILESQGLHSQKTLIKELKALRKILF